MDCEGDTAHPLDGKFEPEAKDIVSSQADAALVSIAVSVKRIADALDLTARLPELALAHATGNAIADVINRGIRDGLTAPINHYGEGIGEAIQGQLERGNR